MPESITGPEQNDGIQSPEQKAKTPQQKLEAAQKIKREAKKVFEEELSVLDYLDRKLQVKGETLKNRIEAVALDFSLDDPQVKLSLMNETLSLMQEAEFCLRTRGEQDLSRAFSLKDKKGISKGLLKLGLGKIIEEVIETEETGFMKLQVDIEKKLKGLSRINDDFTFSLIGGERGGESKNDTRFDILMGLDLLNADPAVYTTLKKQFKNGSLGAVAGGSRKSGLFGAIEGSFKF